MTAFLLTSALGCETIAVQMAPARAPATAPDVAHQAEQALMTPLLAGDYAALPQALEQLTALAVAHPRNARVHLMLGMAHLWALAERGRVEQPPATVTNHAVLSRHYLESARALDGSDARIPGWSGSAGLVISSLLEDEKLKRQSYFMIKNGARSWPEFNKFTLSYTMSRLTHDDERFTSDVVEPMFETMDLCFGVPLDVDKPDWAAATRAVEAFVKRQDSVSPRQRVCRNSAVVPRNLEGYFMHFGDVLTKAGRPNDARNALALARLAPHHAQWAFKDALEERISRAEERVKELQAAKKGEGMMVTSTMACVGCHQR
ncbi:MAG: hypothetical protein AB2A00_31895 [Myxococcota bacterium]